MRRWLPIALLALAVVGVVIAFALPSSRLADCPPRGSGIACAYTTDVHAWLRFIVAAVAVFPAVVVLGPRIQKRGAAAVAVFIAGALVALALASIDGPVPSTNGDCVAYPRCYTQGHPYGWPALATLTLAVFVAIWIGGALEPE